MYAVDPDSLSAAAPQFDVLAQECVTEAKGVSTQGSSLCDDLGDPSVVTAVGSALQVLVTDLQLVHAGLSQLSSGLGESAQGYADNESTTAAAYQQAGSGRPGAR